MIAARLGKELIVSTKNRVGILADISKMLGDQSINIEAAAGYVAGDEAKVMIVTDDNVRAYDFLKKKGFGVSESEIIIVDLENKPGMLKAVSGRLASDKIDLKYFYGTTSVEGSVAKLIMSTTYNEKAIILLSKA